MKDKKPKTNWGEVIIATIALFSIGFGILMIHPGLGLIFAGLLLIYSLN